MSDLNHSTAVFEQIINERRSVRIYDQEAPFDGDVVKKALEMATLSPNSSNMQLWEFYRIKDEQKRQAVAKACMGQKAASTARELVVVVVRPDLWKERQQANLEQMKKVVADKSPKDAKRALSYYTKLIPALYKNDALGFSTLWKKAFVWFMGLKRPMVREVGKQDVRVTLHKSASLAAMTFMYYMRAAEYDTCPMEGFDSRQVKKIIGLPSAAEVCMIIGCGKRTEEGIYSERFRVPNEKVIFEV